LITALYRKSSNEVIKISLKGQPFTDADSQFWGVLTDPLLPDGNEVRDGSTELLGPLRVLGFAKYADVSLNTVRNATQTEIDTCQSLQDDDENQQDANHAADMGDAHPQFRKLIKSILKGIVRENNILANRYNEMRAEMLAASSLANLQNRVQNNTSDAPVRTNQQAFDKVRTDVDKDD